MTCYFRVNGSRFDVEAFLRRSMLPPGRVYYRGDTRFPTLPKWPKRYTRSGFTVRIGPDTWELRNQIRPALVFLRKHRRELKRLSRFPGVQDIRLDFGVNMKEESMGQFFPLPGELIALCAPSNIGLEISVYRWDEWERSQRRASKARKRRPGR